MAKKPVNLSLLSTPIDIPTQIRPQDAVDAVDVMDGIRASPELGVGEPRRPARSVKISILVPVYNEEKTVGKVITSLLSVDYPCDFEIIVINDGSTDATARRLSHVRSPSVVVTRHSHNLGKGVALRTGASVATGTHLLPFDADLEYDPHDLPRMLGPVLTGRCDVVYGARVFGINTVYQSYRYALGNKLLTLTANLLYDSCLADLHTCLKLVPREVFNRLPLTEPGFGLDTELTALLLRRGYRPFEIPVSYHSRSHQDGKKITWRDGLNCLRVLLKIRFGLRSPARGGVPPRAGLAAGLAAGPAGGDQRWVDGEGPRVDGEGVLGTEGESPRLDGDGPRDKMRVVPFHGTGELA
jgi:hypothetical protein